jgi:hypothetical protein
MRRAAMIAAALAAASCADPELLVDFKIRPPYAESIASVTLQILEPAIAEPFSCDELAFGDVDPSVLRLSRTGEVSSDNLDEGTALSDIDRVANKLLLAEGLTQDDQRIVTGCAEVGELDSTLELTIDAEPVARVEPPEGVSLSAVIGQPPPRPVSIDVRDVFGAPLAGIDALYSIEGAQGTGASGRVSSDGQGKLMISPELPARPGPFVLDVRVRWADTPVILGGVIAPIMEPLQLSGRVFGYRTGNIGTMREEGFAAVVAESLASERILVVFEDSMTGMREQNLSEPIVGLIAPVLGIIDFAGRGRDRVIAVNDGAWYEIGPDGSLAERTAYSNPPGTTIPVSVMTTGPCTGSGPMDVPRVLIEFAESIVGEYSTEGVLEGAFPLNADADVVASGCVSDQNNKINRTLVIGFPGGIGVLPAVPEGMEFLVASWFALPSAIAFSPALGDGRRLMFGTQLSVNDIVVSRVSLARGIDSLEVVTEGLDAIPAVPLTTVAGDMDGDELVDAVSLFRRQTGENEQPLAIWAVLGREHRGRRISADVNLGTTGLRDPQLMLVDIDRDGLDDVLLGEVNVSGADSRVEIYPMGPR